MKSINLRKLRYGLLLYVAFDLFFGGICGGLFDLTPAAAAQFTTVSGTVTDPNGIPYSSGTIAATLVSSGSPTLGGLAYTPPSQPVGLSTAGSFVLQLADNTQLSPGGSQWTFTVCSAGGTVQPVIGKGSVCFTSAAITISGASQSITSNLASVALALTSTTGFNITGGVINGHCISIVNATQGQDSGGPCGGSGSPCVVTAGSLQFNNSGAFGCVPDFTFNTHTLSAGAAGILDMHLAATTALLFPGGFPTGLVKTTTATGALSIVTAPAGTIVGNSDAQTLTNKVIDAASNTLTGVGITANPLSQFAPTSSAQLGGVLNDETGTGVVVYNTSPALLGTPDASGATQFKLPSRVGFTTAGTGQWGFDTASNNWHGWQNGDQIAAMFNGALTNGDCPKISIVGGSVTLQDAGSCGNAAGVPTNAQVGTSYLVAASDRLSYLNFSNANSIAVTLPQAGTTGFTGNFAFVACDLGAGVATIAPTVSTISLMAGATYSSGRTSLALSTGQCAWIYSDNTNYFAIPNVPHGLDASLFPGADFCAKVNAAYVVATQAAAQTGAATIDARNFTSPQACNMNIHHGGNRNVHILLPSATVVTSVPQYLPSGPHTWEGPIIGNATQGQGFTIEACGPTAATWNGSSCTVNGINVPQFPNGTTQLVFHNAPHGPFPPGTYACIVCDGGQGSTEGQGWENDGFGSTLLHVRISGGGCTNCFGYYTANAEERSNMEDVTTGNFGGGTAAANVAGVFYDRTEASTMQSGPTHFAIGNVAYGVNNTVTATNSWGLVIEGSGAPCVITGGGGSGATCYVDKVSSGTPHVVLGYPGSGYGSNPTYTVYGNPANQSYGLTQASVDCTGTVTQTAGAATSIAQCPAATDYSNGLALASGPESLHATSSGNPANFNMTGGAYIGGMGNAVIDYLHCEHIASVQTGSATQAAIGGCLQLGNGSDPVSGGIFKAIDSTSTVTAPLVAINAGSDCQQNFWALQFTSVTGTPFVMEDNCLISGTTGTPITFTTNQVQNGFGSIKNMEFYSAGGVLQSYDAIKFQPNMGAIAHLIGPTDQSFSLQGGTNTGTNVAGKDAVIAAGLGTGNATPGHVKLQVPSFSTTSGSAAETLDTAYVVHKKAGSTTTATATNMFNIAVAANQTASFEIVVHVETTQATPQNCSTTETFVAAVQNTAATVTQQTTAGTIGTICSTGTLTLAAAFSAATPSVFSVTPSWTTIVPTGVIITVEIHNLSQQDVSLL